MLPLVLDIAGFLNSRVVSPTLEGAAATFGETRLYFLCTELMGWWGRSTLMQSRHPFLSMAPPYAWHAEFRAFVTSIPELAALVYFESDKCRFADNVSRDTQLAINESVRSSYHPVLRRSLA